MYVGTDTLWLDSEGRFTIWLVPESLARALVASSSLEVFKISFNHIGDIGIAHIAIALQANNTLTSLTLDIYGTYTPTDKAALSLATALTTNTSMEYVKLDIHKSRHHTEDNGRVYQEKQFERIETKNTYATAIR